MAAKASPRRSKRSRELVIRVQVPALTREQARIVEDVLKFVRVEIQVPTDPTGIIQQNCSPSKRRG